MRNLGCFQEACKEISVAAGLWAICGQLSSVSCTHQASGFLGSIQGRALGSLCTFGATFRRFLQHLWVFADNLCTFQTRCSDNAKLRKRQALSAMANLVQ